MQAQKEKEMREQQLEMARIENQRYIAVINNLTKIATSDKKIEGDIIKTIMSGVQRENAVENKSKEKDIDKVNKFYKKVERSKNANANGKEFVELISSIYKDSNNYIFKLPLSTKEVNDLTTFFDEVSLDDIIETIKNYYDWLYEIKISLLMN